MKRFQYTAIDDATRIRELKVYERPAKQSSIDFVDYALEKSPFRIHSIRTDHGHEFQAKFHWHVEDLGIRHVYIKPRTPMLNGKVERSHGTDDIEFYQLLSYTGDVELKRKLEKWERFYNYARPHSAFRGKTPYEIRSEEVYINIKCDATHGAEGWSKNAGVEREYMICLPELSDAERVKQR